MSQQSVASRHHCHRSWSSMGLTSAVSGTGLPILRAVRDLGEFTACLWGRLPCVFCMGDRDRIISSRAGSAHEYSGALPDLLTSRSLVGTLTTPSR